jgi:hypothetical protein
MRHWANHPTLTKIARHPSGTFAVRIWRLAEHGYSVDRVHLGKVLERHSFRGDGAHERALTLFGVLMSRGAESLSRIRRGGRTPLPAEGTSPDW